MPDPVSRLAFRATSSGRWRGRAVGGGVTLFVEQHEVVIRLESSGEELAASLHALSGATWRAGTLALHLADDVLSLADGEGLDRAWHALSQRACALPEVARALRALGGSPRDASGGMATARERFFSPLLQARRRLEGEEPAEWRVASFDAASLAERMRATLAALALERHAERPPHRRALEAGLFDACEALFGQLARVGDAARGVHEADDARRFIAWRAWSEEMRALFVHADRAWRGVAEALRDSDRGISPTGYR